MKKINKIKNKSQLIIILLFIFAVLFMTIGFAQYHQSVNFGGTVVFKPQGQLKITNVTFVKDESHGATATPSFNDLNIKFNMKFTTNKNDDADSYKATFNITIENKTFYDFIYNVPTFNPTIQNKSGKSYSAAQISYDIVSGIKSGDTIESGSTKTFKVTFTFVNPEKDADTYTIDGDFIPQLNEDTSATLYAAVENDEVGNLRGENEYAEFTVNVMNTYKYEKTFTIILDGNEFEAVNLEKKGIPQYTIEPSGKQTPYKFYIKKADGVEFSSDERRVKVLVNPLGEENHIDAGRVTVLVDKTVEQKDEEAPLISNVTATMGEDEGTVKVKWDYTEDGKVEKYTVVAYKVEKGKATQVSTKDVTKEEITFEGFKEGDYYFVVYGLDDSGNTATSTEIANATDSQGHASKSNTVTLKWTYTVVFNVGNYVNTNNSATTAKRREKYTARLTVSRDNYYLGAVTVTMGNKTTENYPVDSDGNIEIQNVDGDITIKADAVYGGCLVQGTKILLANGTYKNIEDIRYTDLLKVYDHIHGGTTECYPIWIEKGYEDTHYRQLTFSDGTYLKTVNDHSIFDVDRKRYINVFRNDECKIGTRVYKWKNNKLEIVTITNIEDREEKVNRYNVVSANYYNIIANDLLTTETTTSVSNLYGFEENAIYGENFYKIREGKKIDYLFISFIPHYLYKGLNIEHAAPLVNSDLNMAFLKKVVNIDTLEPITKKGKRYFMMTTSLDNLNDSNPEKYLYREGSYYKLPKQGAKYFLDTFTNKKYSPGQKVKVEYGMHLKAIN